MILKALLIGIFCWLGASENCQPLGVVLAGALQKPLVGGTIVGIILGKPTEGIMMGAAIQTMFLANVVIGGVATADMSFVAYPSIALALLANADANVAMSLAATVGVIGAALFTLWEAFCSVFYALGDKAIEEGNIKKMKFAYTVLPPAIDFVFRAGLTFAIVLLGDAFAADLLAKLPEIVLQIVRTLGGMLPAVGMSILLSYTIKDKKMVVFFFAGVLAITKMGFNMVAVAVLGIILAVMYYMFTSKAVEAVEAVEAATRNSNDEEEF